MFSVSTNKILLNEIYKYNKTFRHSGSSELGYWIHFNPKNYHECHILISGVPETPYEGGFFHFLMIIPTDYPYKPPTLKLLTTGNGRFENKIRFNPIFKQDGSVCLSILG